MSLLTIAEVGKKITFDDNKGLLSMIVTLFQSKEEDTKYYAAVALGGIAVVTLNIYTFPINNSVSRVTSNSTYLRSSI